MDIDIARHMMRVAFQTARELQDLMGFLKTHCSPEEYEEHARAIATAIDATNVALIHRALAAHPELDEELEAKMAKYQRFI